MNKEMKFTNESQISETSLNLSLKIPKMNVKFNNADLGKPPSNEVSNYTKGNVRVQFEKNTSLKSPTLRKKNYTVSRKSLRFCKGYKNDITLNNVDKINYTLLFIFFLGFVLEI